MKTATILVTTSIIIILLSCSKESQYELTKSEKRLSFELDKNVKNSIFYLAPYKDKDGIEYLTFQNDKENNILFYDINTGEFKFEISPKTEGSNGVGSFLGYHILNLDSIYLTNYDFQEISLIDKNATVKEKIDYEKAEDGTPLSFFCFLTHFYKPAIVIGRDMYIYSDPNRFIDNAPVSAILNLDNNTIRTLPFAYPQYHGSKDKRKRYGWEYEFSRCFDGKRFIYSFYYEENIHVANLAHDSISRPSAKSKFISQVTYPADYGLKPKDLCTHPRYGNLLYDPYREVYYRVAYPRVELDEKKENVRSMELLEYGGKKFSIVILDKEFKVIGETLFPEYTYNPKIMIIKEDGLYICDSHYMNPSFNDDTLSFQRFDLIKVNLDT